MRAAVPTTVVVERRAAVPEPVEFATYFVASEALANTAKYARRDVGDGPGLAARPRPSSRSPTTGSAAPTPAAARACTASPTGSRPSADGSTSAARRGGHGRHRNAAAALSARSDRMSHAPSAATTRPSGTP